MKISIITVSFNSEATIVDTLLSVSAQTHDNIEHIVVDGASRDNTLELVRTHGKRVTRLLGEPDRGIYDAMNKGLGLATGDVVGYLNSDDMFASEHAVAHLAKAFETSGAEAVYGDLVFVDPKDTQRVVRYWKAGTHTPGACARGWMPPHPTLYVRRDALQRSGGFNLAYRLQADFELSLRLIEIQKVPTHYLPEVLVRMRMGGATTGSLRNIIRGNLEASRACRSNGFPGGLRFIARKMASRLPQFLARPAEGTRPSREA